MIYLDNAATTKISPGAQNIRNEVENDMFANSSSLHSFALHSNRLINDAKEKIANVINASPSEIYFTKGATESNNIAISSFSGENSIVLTSEIEHSSVFESVNHFNFKDIIYIKNDEHGFIDISDLENKLNEDVDLVSLIYVSNEVGTIQDIKSISKIIRNISNNAVLHIDATQALGKISCDVKNLDVDLMTFSAHKFHGPKGVGGMYVKSDIASRIKPVMFGGNQQIISSGTNNHPAIAAMAYALDEQINRDEFEYIMDLNMYMRKLITDNIEGYIINTPSNNFSPYILSVAFKNIKSEVLLHMLEMDEIYVSSGSACSKGDNNRLLQALGIDKDYRDGVIRFSFSNDNTRDQLDYTIKVLKKSIDEIRKVMI